MKKKFEEAEKQASSSFQKMRNMEIDNDNYERQLR